MKKIYYVLATIGLLAISCSKDGMLNNFREPEQPYGKETLFKDKPLIEVYPGDDLAAAFNQAKDAGKGAVVKLMPGEFKIGWTEVDEFYGTFTGSGKGVSIITNLPDLDPSELVTNGKLPALITFIGGEVTVSDLSVSLTAMPWLGSQEISLLLFSDYTADFMPDKKTYRS